MAHPQATGVALPDREGSTTMEAAASLLSSLCLDTGRLRRLESSNGAVAGTFPVKAKLLPSLTLLQYLDLQQTVQVRVIGV